MCYVEKKSSKIQNTPRLRGLRFSVKNRVCVDFLFFFGNKSLCLKRTPRQTHYDLFNCTTKTETESTEHTKNNVCKDHTHWTRCEIKTKTLTLESHLCECIEECCEHVLFFSSSFHSFTHKHTDEMNVENLKFTSNKKKLAMSVAPIQIYGQSATNILNVCLFIWLTHRIALQPLNIYFVYTIH